MVLFPCFGDPSGEVLILEGINVNWNGLTYVGCRMSSASAS